MSQEASTGEKALYLMLGAMIGAATALLLAPRSGVETRKLLLTKARESAARLSPARFRIIRSGGRNCCSSNSTHLRLHSKRASRPIGKKRKRHRPR
jgi:hypothetical protein